MINVYLQFTEENKANSDKTGGNESAFNITRVHPKTCPGVSSLFSPTSGFTGGFSISL
jgi:hypothetical protein